MLANNQPLAVSKSISLHLHAMSKKLQNLSKFNQRKRDFLTILVIFLVENPPKSNSKLKQASTL
jgi:hypothetical protein